MATAAPKINNAIIIVPVSSVIKRNKLQCLNTEKLLNSAINFPFNAHYYLSVNMP